MKTVRFSKVIEKSGKPEIYLLLNREDAEFRRALKADRILSLIGAEGSKSTHGEVGYDERLHAQLLVFPKSLKPFEGLRVVGIDYESFADHTVEKPAKKPEKKIPAPKAKSEKPKPSRQESKPEPKHATLKVIPFPKPERVKKEPLDTGEMQAYARRALRALEKNNSVAAYNLLKHMLGES